MIGTTEGYSGGPAGRKSCSYLYDMQVRREGTRFLPPDTPPDLAQATMLVHGALGTNGVVGQCVHAADLLAWYLVRTGTPATLHFGVYLNDDGPIHPGRFVHAFTRSGDWLLDPTRAQFDPQAPFIEPWKDAAARYVRNEDENYPQVVWDGVPGNPLSVIRSLASVDGKQFAREETLEVLQFVGLDELVGPLRRQLRSEVELGQCSICDGYSDRTLVVEIVGGTPQRFPTCALHRDLVQLSTRCVLRHEPPGANDLVEAARALPPLAPARWFASVGRNDPCPCGSGRKYKRCCGA
jgi:hypothetical protein